MKNLYVSLLASALLAACSGPKAAQPVTSKQPQKPGVAAEDSRLVNASIAFQEAGYDGNRPENKAFAESIVGADMIMENGDQTSHRVLVSVLFSNCDMISGTMYGNQKSSDEGNSSSVKLGDSKSKSPSAVGLENKCIGKGGACDQVAVLVSKEDKTGNKPAQAVLVFELNKDSNTYEVKGWPTVKKDVFKNTNSFATEHKCWQEQQPAQKSK